ncbi:MAG: ROK family protein, partial [Hyphomicrobiales bacterium]|nr:ROK family protein [Hyphomicrobiales bacterium]
WIQQASEALSVGIAGIENLFDPQMVVVGGAAPVTLLDRLARGVGDLRASVRQDLGRDRLRVSTLGERSAALGASALPILAGTNV